MIVVLYSTLLLGLLGLIFGLILTYVSKRLAPKENLMVKKVEEALPGYNCGACGYPGCHGYADALASGKEKQFNLCKPGKEPVEAKLKELLA